MKIRFLLLFLFLQLLLITCTNYGLHYGGFYFAILEDESIEIIGLSAKQIHLKTLQFPSTIYGKKVIKINLNSEEGKRLMKGSDSSHKIGAKEVIVPSSIKIIGSYCFDSKHFPDIESVLFKDPRGWYLTYKNRHGATVNLPLDVGDPKKNALLLKGNYYEEYFYDPSDPKRKVYYKEFTWCKK